MMEGPFKEYDLVWAKLAGFSHWPAIIMVPDPEAPPKTSPDMQWVYFLGTHNYAWIEDKNIKPYLEFKAKFTKKSTEDAVIEMDEIIANLEKDPDYKIPFVLYFARKVSPKKTPKRPPSNSISQTSERKRPLKEKNQDLPRKKVRSSTSSQDFENNHPDTVSIEGEENHKNKTVTLDTEGLGTSTKLIGFLAGSLNSKGIIRNLITSGHRLTVWSRSSALLEELNAYAEKQRSSTFKVCDTPAQVVRATQIIFSSLEDAAKAYDMINALTADDALKGKSYVEMTSIDPETSKDFHELVTKAKGHYLEAMLQGNKYEAGKGEVIVLAAGPKDLFVDCQSCFKAMGKASFLLGSIGAASKINLIFQMMRGVFLASLVEGFVMADRCRINLDAFNNIFKITQMSSDYLKNKSEAIVHKRFTSIEDAEEPVEQLQKDVNQGLEMANRFKQTMPLAATVNEILKQSRRMGCDNQDSSCIFRSRC